MNYYRYKRRRNFSNFSIVTWLVIITSVISIGTLILFAIDENYVQYLALNPSNILAGNFIWTILTHMFVHAGIFHLMINMFVLVSLGSLSEKIIGRKRFIWFYMTSGLFAGILSVVLSGFFGASGIGQRIFGDPAIFMVGASGAIFAIAGLYVTLLPKLKFMIIFLPFFSLPAYIMVPGMLFGFWGASIIWNWPIGNVAHFGGFLIGISYGFYLRTKYKKKVARLQRMFK